MLPIASYRPALPVAQQEEIATFLNTFDGAGGNASYNVWTYGDVESLNVAFPESGVVLRQADIDATDFERQWRALTDVERLVVRRWTATSTDTGRFSDGSDSLPARGVAGMNFEVNAKLSSGELLSPEEAAFVEALSSALRSLPPCRGNYLRVDESPHGSSSPWGVHIRVGDIVTNYPRFMSASMADDYAKDRVDGDILRDSTQTLIFYTLRNTCTGIPLLQGAASLTNELETLFPRESCFRVLGYSVAKPLDSDAFPALRIGVLLEQTPTIGVAKNLYTGLTEIIPSAI